MTQMPIAEIQALVNERDDLEHLAFKAKQQAVRHHHSQHKHHVALADAERYANRIAEIDRLLDKETNV